MNIENCSKSKLFDGNLKLKSEDYREKREARRIDNIV